jgi:hypothetical protein
MAATHPIVRTLSQVLLAASLVGTAAAGAAWSAMPQRKQATVPLGESLERSMWKAMAGRDLQAVESMLAPGFLSIHEDGTRDRSQEISLIANLDLGDYTLTEFRETREGASIVVCYFVETAETLDGERIPKRKSARSSVWVMTPNGWQWVHHANLNPMQAK